jgi:hypothetical protein
LLEEAAQIAEFEAWLRIKEAMGCLQVRYPLRTSIIRFGLGSFINRPHYLLSPGIESPMSLTLAGTLVSPSYCASLRLLQCA